MSALAESSHLTHRGQVHQSADSAATFDSTINKRQAGKHASRSYFCCHSRLVRHEELPRWIQVIDATPGWIEKYHRPHQPSVTACLASVFQWNTETVNIWSHLLAFMAAVYFLYDLLTHQFFLGTK